MRDRGRCVFCCRLLYVHYHATEGLVAERGQPQFQPALPRPACCSSPACRGHCNGTPRAHAVRPQLPDPSGPSCQTPPAPAARPIRPQLPDPSGPSCQTPCTSYNSTLVAAVTRAHRLRGSAQHVLETKILLTAAHISTPHGAAHISGGAPPGSMPP
jgi:hypothetical protein